MANIVRIKTIEVTAGSSYNTTVSCRSIDFLYYGTVDGVTFTGVSLGSMPIPIPPSVPYTLEYNDNGYDTVTVTNNGDASVWIVEKF